MPPQNLSQQRKSVWEIVFIRSVIGQPPCALVGHVMVDFSLRFGLNFGIQDHCEDERLQGRRRGVRAPCIQMSSLIEQDQRIERDGPL